MQDLVKYRYYIIQLKLLIGVTPQDYQDYYLAVIKALNNFLTSIPNNTPAILEHTLTRTIAALKYRRAYMLPAGTDTETCYKEQDIWTYALFSACLLQTVWSDNDSVNKAEKTDFEAFCQQFLPEQIFAWLKENTRLYVEWAAFIKGDKLTKSLLAQIICDAERQLFPSEQAVAVKKEVITPSPAASPPALADSFIAWLKIQVDEQRIKINGMPGLLHHVEKGFLIVMPEAWQAFTKANPTNFAKNKSIDNHYRPYLKELTSNSEFIPANKKNYLHRYYYGDWHERLLIEGLLLPYTAFYLNTQLPLINTQLQPDLI